MQRLKHLIYIFSQEHAIYLTSVLAQIMVYGNQVEERVEPWVWTGNGPSTICALLTGYNPFDSWTKWNKEQRFYRKMNAELLIICGNSRIAVS